LPRYFRFTALRMHHQQQHARLGRGGAPRGPADRATTAGYRSFGPNGLTRIHSSTDRDTLAQEKTPAVQACRLEIPCDFKIEPLFVGGANIVAGDPTPGPPAAGAFAPNARNAALLITEKLWPFGPTRNSQVRCSSVSPRARSPPRIPALMPERRRKYSHGMNSKRIALRSAALRPRRARRPRNRRAFAGSRRAEG